MKKIKLIGPLCGIFMLMAFGCEKEKVDSIEHYQLIKVMEYDAEIYTVNGIVEDQNNSIENVYNKDFYINHLIEKIIIRDKKKASFYYSQNEFKEALDLIYTDLSFLHVEDSIFFSNVLNDENLDFTVDIRGELIQDEILIKGVLFEFKFANTGYEGGIEYFPYSVQEIVNRYWRDLDNYSPLDTLSIYPFEIVLRKSNH